MYKYDITFRRASDEGGFEQLRYGVRAENRETAVAHASVTHALMMDPSGWQLYEVARTPIPSIPVTTYIILALAGMQVVEMVAWLLLR